MAKTRCIKKIIKDNLWRVINKAPKEGEYFLIKPAKIHSNTPELPFVATLHCQYTHLPNQPFFESITWKEQAGFYSIKATHARKLPDDRLAKICHLWLGGLEDLKEKGKTQADRDYAQFLLGKAEEIARTEIE